MEPTTTGSLQYTPAQKSQTETVLKGALQNFGNSEDQVILNDNQLKNIPHASCGQFILTNPKTNQFVPIKLMWACGCDGNDSIMRTSEIVKNKLGLNEGDEVRLQRIVDQSYQIMFACKQNRSNPFGQKKSKNPLYEAKAVLALVKPDKVPGCLEVFLTHKQRGDLNIGRHLSPLCGSKKYEKLKRKSPRSFGLVKVSHNGRECEAHVHAQDEFSSGAAIAVSQSLRNKLDARLGGELFLCSRFENGNKQSGNFPKIDYLTLFKESSLEELWERFREDREINYCQEACRLLEYLSNHGDQLAGDPELFIKFSQMDRFINTRSIEFKDFLLNMKKHINVIQNNWDVYTYFIENELEEGKKYQHPILPPLIEILLKLGLSNLPNSSGETLVHLVLRNGYETYEWGNTYQADYKARTNQGMTPIHYLCKYGNFDLLINLMCEEKKNLGNFNELDNEGKTPLHYTCQYQDAAMIFTLLTKYPKCSKSLSIKDQHGMSPLEYLSDESVIGLFQAFLFGIQLSEKKGFSEKAEKQLKNVLLHLPKGKLKALRLEVKDSLEASKKNMTSDEKPLH